MDTLAGPRLHLRPLSPGDAALYAGLYADPDTMRHVLPPAAGERARRAFDAALAASARPWPTARVWTLVRPPEIQAFGLVGLDPDGLGGAEVGAMIPPARQGQGYATEAIALLAAHAFKELGLVSLHTRHADGHGLAEGLMQRLGFEPAPRQDGPHPVRWRLSRARWQALQGDK